jgi:hypothetical protein
MQANAIEAKEQEVNTPGMGASSLQFGVPNLLYIACFRLQHARGLLILPPLPLAMPQIYLCCPPTPPSHASAFYDQNCSLISLNMITIATCKLLPSPSFLGFWGWDQKSIHSTGWVRVWCFAEKVSI